MTCPSIVTTLCLRICNASANASVSGGEATMAEPWLLKAEAFLRLFLKFSLKLPMSYDILQAYDEN